MGFHSWSILELAGHGEHEVQGGGDDPLMAFAGSFQPAHVGSSPSRGSWPGGVGVILQWFHFGFFLRGTGRGG